MLVDKRSGLVDLRYESELTCAGGSRLPQGFGFQMWCESCNIAMKALHTYNLIAWTSSRMPGF
jgi:hypothetical protein